MDLYHSLIWSGALMNWSPGWNRVRFRSKIRLVEEERADKRRALKQESGEKVAPQL